MPRSILALALLAACTDTGSAPSDAGPATGRWEGTLYWAMPDARLTWATTLDLTDDDGAVTGTADLVVDDETTGSSYVFDVTGARSGAELELELVGGDGDPELSYRFSGSIEGALLPGTFAIHQDHADGSQEEWLARGALEAP